jgi:phenylpropionate dioxygenase-like ring-hydroxylating dioxygenase large terminal subunit
MKLRSLFKNEFLTLLTQGETHESLFEKEIHGHVPQPPLPEEARRHLERWRMPETGFRNYWYPVIRSKHLKTGPIRRRLLGEDIVLWRDGGKVNALADRCPHRGASLSRGHIRFPGSGTISCPYHGWTYDGTGQLRACIQEGPQSLNPGKVRTKAYPVEERLDVVWVWIGDTEPVPIEEDLPMAMKIPGVVSLVHFTKVWNTNWSLLFDNFIDGLHAPYLHRLSPQFLLRRLAFRAVDGRPHFRFVEHDGKVLECAHTRGAQRPEVRQGLVYEMEYPGVGKFPQNQWWRIRGPKLRPQENFLPGIPPGSFLHGLPSYVHTVHKDLYFTQFIIPVDRYHLYNMCALTGHLHGMRKHAWRLYYQIFRITHDRMFIGQDHRVLRYSTFGPERLSPMDQDVVYWRKFAVRNARGYLKEGPSKGTGPSSPDDGEEYNNLREAF